MRTRRGITRQADGSYRVRLPDEEREILAALPEQMRVAFETNEPSLYRLFPPAYHDDPASNEDYHRLVGDGLVDGRLAALAELERTARAAHLTAEELESWLGAVESLRLALGTQLGVTDESSFAEVDPSHGEAPRVALYAYLSWLQEEIVAALSASLPS